MSAAREKLAQETIAALDAIGGDDPEGAHSEADDLILTFLGYVDSRVAEAYERVPARCRWWACA